jgi:hypothetical protein
MLPRSFLASLIIGSLAWAGCAQGGDVTQPPDNGTTDTGAGGSGTGGATTGTGGSPGTGGALGTGGHKGQGGHTGEGGHGGAGGKPGTGGSGGATTTSAGGAGGGATTTSAGGGGVGGGAPDAGVCAEQPCKLVGPQCGCAAGKACVPTQAGARTCNLAGNVAWGGECDGATKRCQAGYDCVATGATGTCMKFCDADAQCTAPGGICTIQLVDGNQQPIAGAVVCSPNCDPTTNTGCPVAGTGCTLGQEQAGQKRFFSLCDGTGAAGQGQACTKDSDCKAMYGCFTNAQQKQVCLEWCNAAKQSCPGGLQCVPLSDGNGGDVSLGNLTLGACQ